MTRIAAVVSTAGHVDHGKTALVRALTGMETDRLSEERARGISIELGFAWRDSALGRIAFIDVPGHERFVRQMVAGATGIDAVILVVAADEGVMPQTREHLAICGLLGIARGLVVLSRCDLVDADFLELAREDVAAAVAGTFLEGAPVELFSIHDVAAPARVLAALDGVVAKVKREDASDRPFAMAVDRVFSRPGFGTIVTGTTRSGVLAVGDHVAIHPVHGAAFEARVRGLEQHGESVTSVAAGHRVAVNLPGVAADLERGARVVHPGQIAPASMWDVEVTALATLPEALGDRERGLACFGATVVEGTLVLLDRDALPAGETTFAQLRLASPVALLPGERWIFRGFRELPDGGSTLAGGWVVAPSIRARRRRDGVDEIARIAGPVADAVEAFAAAHSETGASTQQLQASLPWPRAALERAVARDSVVSARGRLVLSNAHMIVARAALDALRRAVEDMLGAHHRVEAASAGMPLDELRTRLRPGSEPTTFQAIIEAFIEEGRLCRDGSAIALRGHRPTITLDQGALDAALVEALTSAAMTPPRVDELALAIASTPTRAQVDAAIQRLVVAGRVVRVQKDMAFATSVLSELEARVRTWFSSHDWLDAQGLKDITGASRKWTIPLGEWLDRARVTVRVDDRRKLRG